MKTIIGYIIAILFLIGAVIGDITSVKSMNADVQSKIDYLNAVNTGN